MKNDVATKEIGDGLGASSYSSLSAVEPRRLGLKSARPEEDS